MLQVEFETMGCHARAIVDAPPTSAARRVLEALPAWFSARERVLTRFQPTSALSMLNALGARQEVDELLWQAIEVALRAAEATNGLVTPTILGALEEAGYDRPFSSLPAERDGGLGAVSAAPDWRAIEREATTRSIRLPRGVRLDLGGTAKGWSVDVAAAALANFGPALVDVGGDIAMRGVPRSPWPIAVADPQGGEPIDLLLVEVGGVATSGRDFRRWRRAGRELHHLIDPRTGAPADTDVSTATVIAPSALEADVAAKRVLLEGSAAGLAFIETRPELAAAVVGLDGRVRRSAAFDRYVWRAVA